MQYNLRWEDQLYSVDWLIQTLFVVGFTKESVYIYDGFECLSSLTPLEVIRSWSIPAPPYAKCDLCGVDILLLNFDRKYDDFYCDHCFVKVILADLGFFIQE